MNGSERMDISVALGGGGAKGNSHIGVLRRLEKGMGNLDDIDLLVGVAKKIEGNTICPLGDAAAWPVAAAIRHFRHEFEYHVLHAEKVKDPKHGHKEPIMPVKPAPVVA